MFLFHAVTFLLDLVPMAVVQKDQPLTSHEVVLVIPQSGYVAGKIFPSSKDYDEQRNFIQNISAPENTI